MQNNLMVLSFPRKRESSDFGIVRKTKSLDSRFRGNDNIKEKTHFAKIQEKKTASGK
ncbi:MAG: hypothetical protein HY586_03870 [Candidatus Omnitrophica bacterium]|nr:hypothetical protein [Candidatus Omnitrophota bacterium]